MAVWFSSAMPKHTEYHSRREYVHASRGVFEVLFRTQKCVISEFSFWEQEDRVKSAARLPEPC